MDLKTRDITVTVAPRATPDAPLTIKLTHRPSGAEATGTAPGWDDAKEKAMRLLELEAEVKYAARQARLRVV